MTVWAAGANRADLSHPACADRGEDLVGRFECQASAASELLVPELLEPVLDDRHSPFRRGETARHHELLAVESVVRAHPRRVAFQIE